MKKTTSFSIVVKIIIIALIIYYIPHNNYVYSKVYQGIDNQSQPVQVSVAAKRIHIYNTHQGEEYADYNVVSGANYLKECLVKENYYCDVEGNDFEGYKSIHSIAYKNSYSVSNMYLENTLSSNGNYNLIIDFHRDSLDKKLSTLTYNNVSYAKMMFVVGKSSGKYESVLALSNQLSENLNKYVSGISRGIMEKKNHYNQGTSDNMVLIEVGGQGNTKAEVNASLEILGKAIKDYLQ